MSTAKQDVASDVVVGRESLLFDLIHRVSYFDKHYFYPRESFLDDESFSKWKEEEISKIVDGLKPIMFPTSGFYGVLRIKGLCCLLFD